MAVISSRAGHAPATARADLSRVARVCVSLVLLAEPISTGCQPRPKAPALIDEPVFQSDEGFRFLVPEGWIMAARSSVPPGPAEKERLLVQYRRATGEHQATLEVSLADLPEDTDLAAYLSGPSFSVKHWDTTDAPESVQAGGRQGKRYRFAADIKGGRLARDVTVFRRDGRVYFFTLLYTPGDSSAPEQVHRSIRQLVWTR